MWRGATATCRYAAISFEASTCRANASALPPCTTFSSPGLTGRQRQNGSSVRSRARCSQPLWNRWSWRLRRSVHLENHKVADPMIEAVLDLGYGADIHDIARKHPVPHWQAIARHGKPNDDLRSIRAAIFRQAPLARRLIGLGTRCHAAFNDIVFIITLVTLVDFKMQRRGIVEDQLHIQGEQVGKAEIQGLLDGILMGFEQIHSAVEMM